MRGCELSHRPGKGSTTMTSNVEMPIPMPDVPGADAGRGGLPDRSDLTLVQRAIVDTSAIADLGLRTAIASLVGVSMLPTVATGIVRGSDMKRERKNLEFYAELASHHDPALSFPAPTRVPEVSSRPANAIAEYIAHGNVHNISFQSSFEPVNPDMRATVEAVEAQQRCLGPALAPRRRTAPDTVCDPRVHGIGVHVQRPVLLAAVVLPHRLRRHALHIAVPRPPSRKGFALQRLRILLPGHGRVRRDDGPGRARLPLGAGLVAAQRRRADRADRHVAGRLHLGSGRLGRRPTGGGDPQRPGGDPGVGVRPVVARQQADCPRPRLRRHESRGFRGRIGLPLPAELPADSAQGPPADHHRTR